MVRIKKNEYWRQSLQFVLLSIIIIFIIIGIIQIIERFSETSFKSTKSTNKELTTQLVHKEAVTDVEPTIKNEAYYKSKGYQVFSEYNFTVKCPATLRDISRQSNDSFDFNYAGNTDNAFYQIAIIKLPTDKKNMSRNEYKELLESKGGGKYVLWGEDELPAYLLNDYTQNGYRGRGIAVGLNGMIYTFNVMSKDNLDADFNSFTNSVYFFDTPNISNTVPEVESQSKISAVGLTYTNRQKGFSIDYPKGWEINEVSSMQAVAFLAPENEANFRTNFNVITSNRTETLDRLFQIAQQQITNSNVFAGYKLDDKEYVSINGINGIKIVASYKLSGYAVKGVQYILKKADNTVYTITFTVGEPSYQNDKYLVENIIQSFKSF